MKDIRISQEGREGQEYERQIICFMLPVIISRFKKGYFFPGVHDYSKISNSLHGTPATPAAHVCRVGCAALAFVFHKIGFLLPMSKGEGPGTEAESGTAVRECQIRRVSRSAAVKKIAFLQNF